MKKILLLAIAAISLTCIEAKQPAMLGGKGSQSDMISMDQLQEMQQMEQILTMLSLKFVPKFFAKYPKFRASLVPAYKQDPTAVEGKVTTQLENSSVIDPILKEVLQEIGADKEMTAMIKELMPLIKQLFAQDIMKWIHITALAGMQVQ
jgi:hypothetical protein